MKQHKQNQSQNNCLETEAYFARKNARREWLLNNWPAFVVVPAILFAIGSAVYHTADHYNNRAYWRGYEEGHDKGLKFRQELNEKYAVTNYTFQTVWTTNVVVVTNKHKAYITDWQGGTTILPYNPVTNYIILTNDCPGRWIYTTNPPSKKAQEYFLELYWQQYTEDHPIRITTNRWRINTDVNN